MILDLFVLAGLTALFWAINLFDLGSFFDTGQHAALAFGFILLASYVSGKLSRRLHMPALTGYLLAGFFFGPSVLGALSESLRILTPTVLDELSIFSTMALGLIAFNAGGELKLEPLKAAIRSIGYVIAGQTIACIALIIPFVLLVGGQFEMFQDIGTKRLIAVSLLLTVIALANSPSSTLALIVEYKAKGQLTTVTLGTTILKDVVVIVSFSLAMVAAGQLIDSGGQAGFAIVGRLAWEVFGSLAIGLGLGWLLGQYIKYVGRESPIIILALSFLAMALSSEFHLSGLLLCMAAGFYVENFTNKGKLLIEAIEHYSLPVFILFFTITGANLQLPLLLKVWPLAVALVMLRIVALFLGTTLGSAAAKDPPPVKNNLWLGFTTQAGVSLGLATIIQAELPVLGQSLATIVIAGVAINQIIGPIAFRFGLLRSGEGKVE